MLGLSQVAIGMRYGSVFEMVEATCDKEFTEKFARQLIQKQDAQIHRLLAALSKHEPDVWKYLVDEDERAAITAKIPSEEDLRLLETAFLNQWRDEPSW